MDRQTASSIIMVRPASFGFNQETALNNSFQSKDSSHTAAEIRQKAIEEFDLFVEKLRSVGIAVMVFHEADDVIRPDAIFPNNWISFHQDGSIVTYPMYSEKRRQERSALLIEQVAQKFDVKQRYPLESYEAEGLFLEGTGSMILDRVHKIVYACLSPRTNEKLLARFAAMKNMKEMVFKSVDRSGQPIYHTNVMMALGDSFVVINLDSIPDLEEKSKLIDLFNNTNKEIIEIDYDQMESFAGNMLQVRNDKNVSHLIMSTAAYDSLQPAQLAKLESHTNILHSAIPTIETIGGGSVRCMMAENFLPLRGM